MAEHPAGWYPDPKGEAAQRYWDGAAWTEHVDGPPRGAVPPPLPPAPGEPPMGGYARPAHAYPRSSQAGWALGLSIAGLLCCGPASIAGLLMGRSELQAIDQGTADPAQRGLAQSAYVVGIVGVVLWVLLLGAYLALALGSSS